MRHLLDDDCDPDTDYDDDDDVRVLQAGEIIFMTLLYLLVLFSVRLDLELNRQGGVRPV